MFEATTILAYKGQEQAVIGGDGQVTFGNAVLKGNATKIRKLYKDQILAGFAGSTADALIYLICLKDIWSLAKAIC